MHCFRLPFDLSASARSGGHCRRRGEWEGGDLMMHMMLLCSI